MMKKNTLARGILALLTTVALASCANEGDTGAGGPGTAESAVAQTTEQQGYPGIGEAVEAPGVTLTVLRIAEAEERPVLERNRRPDVAATETAVPDSGGKFVVVETRVENTGQEAWDLTCGFAIQANVFDERDRKFEPVDDLHRIPGNPGCNEDTNPGFTKNMTWVFMLPVDAEPTLLGFADPSTHFDDHTFIDLTTGEETPPTTTERRADPTTPSSPAEAPQETVADRQPTQPAPQPEPQPAPAPAAAPAYGAPCSAAQALQPAVSASGDTLVCVGMGNGLYTWVYGPSGQGAGTASAGGACVDGEQGGQDAQGRMMMCINGEWIYGP